MSPCSPLVVAARAVPPCPGSPESWTGKATMRTKRVSNDLVWSSDKVSASMIDSRLFPSAAPTRLFVAAELCQEDRQLDCREAKLKSVVLILGRTPDRRDTRSQHLLSVRGERASNFLARAAAAAGPELINPCPKFDFFVLGPKLAGEMGHGLKDIRFGGIRVQPIMVRSCGARQLEAKFTQAIMLLAHYAGLGHEFHLP